MAVKLVLEKSFLLPFIEDSFQKLFFIVKIVNDASFLIIANLKQ